MCLCLRACAGVYMFACACVCVLLVWYVLLFCMHSKWGANACVCVSTQCCRSIVLPGGVTAVSVAVRGGAVAGVAPEGVDVVFELSEGYPGVPCTCHVTARGAPSPSTEAAAAAMECGLVCRASDIAGSPMLHVLLRWLSDNVRDLVDRGGVVMSGGSLAPSEWVPPRVGAPAEARGDGGFGEGKGGDEGVFALAPSSDASAPPEPGDATWSCPGVSVLPQ